MFLIFPLCLSHNIYISNLSCIFKVLMCLVVTMHILSMVCRTRSMFLRCFIPVSRLQISLTISRMTGTEMLLRLQILEISWLGRTDYAQCLLFTCHLGQAAVRYLYVIH